MIESKKDLIETENNSLQVNIFDLSILKSLSKKIIEEEDEFYFLIRAEKIINKIGQRLLENKILKLREDKSNARKNNNQNNYNKICRECRELERYIEYGFSYEFNELFTINDFKGFDFTNEKNILQEDVKKIIISLLPICLSKKIDNEVENKVIEILKTLYIHTKYSKKDEGNELITYLQEFSLYSIHTSIRKYCKENKNYPSTAELVEFIKVKNIYYSKIFVNIQYLLQNNA